MVALRVLILIALIVVTEVSASAQGGAVATWVAADNPAGCDQVAYSMDAEDLEAADSGALDDQRFFACLTTAGAIFFGGCELPITHSVLPEVVSEGEAYVVCNVQVAAMEDREVNVDPADFLIIDNQNVWYEFDPSLEAPVPEELRLTQQTLKLHEIAEGRVFFFVEESMERPFLLGWLPSYLADGYPAVIVVDRFLPWEEPDAPTE